MKVSDKNRTKLIRMGNQAFNEGNIDQAAKIFKAVKYQAGLVRLGDHYYFDKRQPLMAYGYYRLAKHEKMISKITDGFLFALRCWISPDKAGGGGRPTRSTAKKENRKEKKASEGGGISK